MNLDDLRQGLAYGAANQPPPSSELREGVSSAVRRQRQRRWLAVAPVGLVIFLGGTALGASQRDVATLDTVSDPTVPATAAPSEPEPNEPQPTLTLPEPEGEPSAPPVTDPEPPAPDEPAGSTGGDCGTITVDAPEFEQLPDEPTEPLECFARALEADAAATLTVVGETPDGSMTAVLTSAPGQRVTIAMDGEITADVPELADLLGDWLPDDDDGAPDHCEVELDVSALGWETLGDVDFESIGCVVDAALSGDGGTIAIHLVDDEGGDLVLTTTFDEDQVTVAAEGAVTIDVPDELLPSELLDLIPSDLGIDASSFAELDDFGDFGDLGCESGDDLPWCD
jgi:hypothetical protein